MAGSVVGVGGVIVLALDTATSRTDVAVVHGQLVLAHMHADGPTVHGEVLGALVADALETARVSARELDSIAVGTGPGPFTGLRVGLAFARTLAFASSIPVYGICTLDVIAAAAARSDEFLVATDARRKEIYWAHYRGHERLDGPHVGKPAEVAARFGPMAVVGEGARTYASLFANPGEALPPDASVLAHLAIRGRSEGRAMPVDAQYLRQPDVTV